MVSDLLTGTDPTASWILAIATLIVVSAVVWLLLHLVATTALPEVGEPMVHLQPLVHDAGKELGAPGVEPDHAPRRHRLTIYRHR